MRASMRVEPSPAVPELRRVIGDGAGTPDAEVDGLDDAGLLGIHRSMATPGSTCWSTEPICPTTP